MKVCDYFSSFFQKKKIKVVFGMTGGMIAFIIDALYRGGKTRFISMHHEQAAAFAAEAYGRMTGKPGVAMGTSGPGATNMLTGICSCYFDSSPAMFITGQVSSKDFKRKGKIRQQGFQETDIVSIVKPVSKNAVMINGVNEVSRIMEKAYWLSIEGRPGPVLIDVPIDIQQQKMRKMSLSLRSRAVNCDGLEIFLRKMNKNLSLSKRPLILVGGGVRASRSRDLFLKWLDRIDIPVVNSLMAVDVIPYGHPDRVGMIGSYGNRYANLAVSECDFLLVLGSRLDIRQTGTDLKIFKKIKSIFHVDCDEAQLNNRVKDCTTVRCDLNTFFNSAVKSFLDMKLGDISAWKTQIENLRNRYPDIKELTCYGDKVNPNYLMHMISRFSQSAIGYAVDVGQHQMWAAQSLELNQQQRFLTSGGMGSMGFALPAAIGMTFAFPHRPVVLIAGDGGFQVNIQELETVRRNKLPLKMVVVNNHCLGMVRQFQGEHLRNRYPATLWGYSVPDLKMVSEAYGIPARSVRLKSEIENALRWLWRQPLSPAMLEINLPMRLNVFPKVRFGASIKYMDYAK